MWVDFDERIATNVAGTKSRRRGKVADLDATIS
jgi:hypothetical protein